MATRFEFSDVTDDLHKHLDNRQSTLNNEEVNEVADLVSLAKTQLARTVMPTSDEDTWAKVENFLRSLFLLGDQIQEILVLFTPTLEDKLVDAIEAVSQHRRFCLYYARSQPTRDLRTAVQVSEEEDKLAKLGGVAKSKCIELLGDLIRSLKTIK